MDLNTLLQCFWVLFVLSVPFTTYSGFDEYLFRSSPYTGLVLGRDFQNVFFPYVLTGQVPVTPLRWIVFDLASFFLPPVNLLTFLAIPSAFACLKKSSIFPQKVCLPPPPPAPDSAHRHDRRLEGVGLRVSQFTQAPLICPVLFRRGRFPPPRLRVRQDFLPQCLLWLRPQAAYSLFHPRHCMFSPSSIRSCHVLPLFLEHALSLTARKRGMRSKWQCSSPTASTIRHLCLLRRAPAEAPPSACAPRPLLLRTSGAFRYWTVGAVNRISSG